MSLACPARLRRIRSLVRAPAPSAVVAFVLTGLASASCSRGSSTSTAPGSSAATLATGAPSVIATSAPGCTGNDAASFVAPAWLAPHARQHVCSDADLDDYVRDCLDASTALPIRCEQFHAERTACAECLLPKDTTMGVGAFLTRKGSVELNVGGCIALGLGDLGAEGCGAREQAARECVAFACGDCANFAACAARARRDACASHQLRTCPELAVAATCALDKGIAQDIRPVGQAFCGL